MTTIEKFEKDQIAKLTEGKKIPSFSQGDTLRVDVRVKEGSRERIQAFEGVCIAKSNRGLNSSFTVRKISYGEGVERVFPLYSPIIDKITVLRKGKVRRAKLYYLRGRTGKAARISEKVDLKAVAEAKARKGANSKKSKAESGADKAAAKAKTGETKKAPAKKAKAKKTKKTKSSTAKKAPAKKAKKTKAKKD